MKRPTVILEESRDSSGYYINGSKRHTRLDHSSIQYSINIFIDEDSDDCEVMNVEEY
jgi:hypothetical protein